MTGNRSTPAGLVPLLFVAAVGLTACDTSIPDRGRLDAYKAAAKSCPNGEVVGVVADDISASQRSPEIEAERRRVTKEALTKVAICGGDATVVAISRGTSDTRTLFDGPLKPAGATLIARLRKVDKLVKPAMREVTESRKAALEEVAPKGTDVEGMFRLGAEYAAEHPQAHLILTLLTDGLTSVGRPFANRQITVPQAAAAARRARIYQLPKGTQVEMSGIGRVAKAKQPPTKLVDAVKKYWETYAELAGAASWRVSTDDAAGVQ